MRIALIDRPGRDGTSSFNRFADIAPLLAAHGHETILLDGVPPRSARDAAPILTGLNRAIASAPMIEANALAHHLAELGPDIIIAPLRGGIAQGVLMARTCGEGFAGVRVALWCDTPSVTKFLSDDGLSTGIAPLIADALERQAFMSADALIIPADVNIEITALGDRVVPSFRATLRRPQIRAAALRSPPERITEIVFAGAMTRRAGLLEFIEAMVRLSKNGLMAGRTVTFLGPVASTSQGIGKEWLGLRAGNWAFPFRVLDMIDHGERQRYLSNPHRLAVAIADDPDEFAALDDRHVALLRGSADRRSLLSRLDDALATSLGHRPGPEPPKLEAPDLDWPTLVSRLAEFPRASLPSSVPLEMGVTVCIVHFNRLKHLADALMSIPDEVDGHDVEILVLDNASDIPSIEIEIRRIAGPRKLLRVIRLETSIPQAAALNRGIAEAQFETILFLDDDNYFAPDGVLRMTRAIATGRLDIAVTALDIFDDGVREPAPSMGRLIFLGAAHSAGLFFNAFGDTAMAVRRDVFRQFGGFADPGYSYPSLDWVTLARAQAMGLRIGALQWPAVRYRRNTARADNVANKLDQEGARSLVFDAYGKNFDGPLLARYAQKLHLEEM